jgi:hypothetical protein
VIEKEKFNVDCCRNVEIATYAHSSDHRRFHFEKQSVMMTTTRGISVGKKRER